MRDVTEWLLPKVKNTKTNHKKDRVKAMEKRFVYADNAATTAPSEEVIKAMMPPVRSLSMDLAKK